MALTISALTNATKIVSNTLTNKAPFTNQGVEDMDGGQQLLFIFVPLEVSLK